MFELLNFISQIREQWYNLILIMGFNKDFMSSQECQFILDDFYSLFTCSNTANFLWYLLFGTKVEYRKKSPEQIKLTNQETKVILDSINIRDDKNINLYYCYVDSIGYEETVIFPEHIWILLQYKGNWYILQSFYCAYTINSPYGFIKISDSESYINMLKFINDLCLGKYFEMDVKLEYKKLFSQYTHINLDKWAGDVDYFLKDFKFEMIKMTINDEREFIQNVYNKICNNIEKLSANNIVSYEYDLVIYTAYTDIVIDKNDVHNTSELLEILSDLTGLHSKHFRLINIQNTKNIKYVTHSDSDEVMSVEMKMSLKYSIQDVISDISTSFKCLK